MNHQYPTHFGSGSLLSGRNFACGYPFDCYEAHVYKLLVSKELIKTKTFNMIAYTEKDQKGEKTIDSWLVRSWEDKAVQPGRTTHSFEISSPADVTEVEVQVALNYQLADKVWPMTQASQKIPMHQRKE